MNLRRLSPMLFFMASISLPAQILPEWTTTSGGDFDMIFTNTEEESLPDLIRILKIEVGSIESFFRSDFTSKFLVRVHPDRKSLDRQWQMDWKMPDFHSECWMVASGVAKQLDLLSPSRWETQACEHPIDDTLATQRLIGHEVVHVFHGQQNVSPDFSETDGVDWFVEGLATYVSGQCDEARMIDVRKAVRANTAPGSLDSVWMGKDRYALSGSIVMYIDRKYGRETLRALLPFNRKDQILSQLEISEASLVDDWRHFVLSENQ